MYLSDLLCDSAAVLFISLISAQRENEDVGEQTGKRIGTCCSNLGEHC